MSYIVLEKSKEKNKFKVGDIAISLADVEFMDGSWHKINQRIKITKKTLAYFNVMQKYYDKV